MDYQKILDVVINKFHILIGCVGQATLIIWHFKTGKVIDPGLANTMYAFYGFLLGHAFTYQRYPDAPGTT